MRALGGLPSELRCASLRTILCHGRSPAYLTRYANVRSVASLSESSGKGETGHIEAGPNEGILFFDSESIYQYMARRFGLA